MKENEKVKKILDDNNGIVTAMQLKEESVPYTVINEMIDTKELKRVDRGIYINNDSYYEDEYFIFQKKHPNIIFSHNSSLYIFGMTERVPHQMEITVKRNYHVIPKNDEFVIFRVPDNIYDLGITTGNTAFGNKVKCYNIERTIIDIIISNKTLDTESRNKAVRECVKSKNFDYDLMLEYARKMKVYDKIKTIMDVVI